MRYQVVNSSGNVETEVLCKILLIKFCNSSLVNRMLFVSFSGKGVKRTFVL